MKRKDGQKFVTMRDVLLGACIVLMFFWAVNAVWESPAAAPLRINGNYLVTFGGPGTGTGSAVVTPKFVKITSTVTDEQGNKLAFTASKLDIDSSTYRFKGTAMLGGVATTVSGRLDADDSTLKSCRLVATYLATDGKAGRIVGKRN